MSLQWIIIGCHQAVGKLAGVKGNYEVMDGLSAGAGNTEIHPSQLWHMGSVLAMSTGR